MYYFSFLIVKVIQFNSIAHWVGFCRKLLKCLSWCCFRSIS